MGCVERDTTMRPELQPGSRQWDIVELLARQGPMTVAEMGDAMGLAKTSMRQHIERLDWGGWVDRTRRPHGPGRPTDARR